MIKYITLIHSDKYQVVLFIMLNISEKPCFPHISPWKVMTDRYSQRTKRMPQFYFQDLADETASRRQFVDLLFIDHVFTYFATLPPLVAEKGESFP
jgi:hypothetical protein